MNPYRQPGPMPPSLPFVGQRWMGPDGIEFEITGQNFGGDPAFAPAHWCHGDDGIDFCLTGPGSFEGCTAMAGDT